MTEACARAPSLPAAIHLGPGVADLLGDALDEIDEIRDQEGDCADYEQLAAHRDTTLGAARSLLGCLIRLLATSSHDGPDLHVELDTSSGGLFFRYPRSGYHGGLIRHAGPAGPRWQIHT